MYVHVEQLGCHSMYSYEILYTGILRHYVKEIQVLVYLTRLRIPYMKSDRYL